MVIVATDSPGLSTWLVYGIELLSALEVVMDFGRLDFVRIYDWFYELEENVG